MRNATLPSIASILKVGDFQWDTVCAVCATPIVGTRYRCIECPQLDLCEAHASSDVEGHSAASHQLVPLHHPQLFKNVRRTSVQDLLLSAFTLYQDRPYLGLPYDGSHEQYRWWTYGEVWQQISAVAAAFRFLAGAHRDANPTTDPSANLMVCPDPGSSSNPSPGRISSSTSNTHHRSSHTPASTSKEEGFFAHLLAPLSFLSCDFCLCETSEVLLSATSRIGPTPRVSPRGSHQDPALSPRCVLSPPPNPPSLSSGSRRTTSHHAAGGSSRPGPNRGPFVVLCAGNSVEWAVTEFACCMAQHLLIPLFDRRVEHTLGAVLDEFDPVVVVLDVRWHEAFTAACHHQPRRRRHVVLIGDPVLVAQRSTVKSDVRSENWDAPQCLSFDSLQALGVSVLSHGDPTQPAGSAAAESASDSRKQEGTTDTISAILALLSHERQALERKRLLSQPGEQAVKSNRAELREDRASPQRTRPQGGPNANPLQDIAALFATSGSSGLPKFCVRREATMCALVGDGIAAEHFDDRDPSPMHLVVSHFAESAQRRRLWVNTVQGGQHALHDNDWAGQCGIPEAVRHIRPTSFSAAPLALLELYNRIQHDIDASPLPFSEARRDVLQRYSRQFAPVAARTPQRQLVMGGAGIGPHVLELLREVLHCEFVDGYGTTEVGLIAAGGRLRPGVTVRLESLPHLGYTIDDKPFPRGEICVSTPIPFDGYFRRPLDTARALTADGFYRTGDIGEQPAADRVRVIDRKSNAMKLANGKVVALGALELLYSEAEGVAHVCLVADPGRSYVLAVVALRGPRRPGAGVRGAVLRGFAAVARREGLAPFELPTDVHVAPEPFTVANGLLSPSLNVDRAAVARAFAADIAAMRACHEAGQDVVFQALDALTESDRSGDDPGLSAALQDLGLDSMKLVLFAGRVRALYGVQLPIPVLLTVRSLPELRSAIRAARPRDVGRPPDADPDDPQTMAAIADLRGLRPSDPAPAPPGPAWPGLDGVDSVFLTGATGFLGMALLVQMLRDLPQIRVRCLVRGPHSAMRLMAAAARQRLPLDADRVEVLEGDVAAPGLGLDAPRRAAVVARTQLVVHAAAGVNWSASYAALHPSNVRGTLEVLQLCRDAGARLVFLSSGAARATRMVAETDLRRCQGQGYALTKLVAEAAVWHAWEAAAFPCLVLRPGYIGFSTTTGAANPRDVLSRLVRGCIEMQAGYEGDTPMTMLPVDTFARLSSRVMRQPAPPRLFHPMISPAPMLTSRALFDAMAGLGHRLQLLPYATWYERLQAAGPPDLQVLAPHLAEDAPPLATAAVRCDTWDWLDFEFPRDVPAEQIRAMVRFLLGQGVVDQHAVA